MMTVRSIGSQGAPAYAKYLDGKTVAPELGDYYLGPEGEPIESPGRWLASPQSLTALGIDPTRPVDREDLIALMEGRRPGTEDYLRPAGPTGTRNAGVDVTLSAPKSVSVVWALADPRERLHLETIHQDAVTRTVDHLRCSVPSTTERVDGVNQPAIPRDLLAAAFQHSTARGISDRAPDPQLHSHVILTSVVRRDGRVAAVRDRSMYRAAREGGAYYRAALAEGLARAGYEIERGTGKGGRYFELAGVNHETLVAFSGRSREIERAVRVFEAREGRKPIENELQLIKLASRQSKQPQTTRELTEAWAATAQHHEQPPVEPQEHPRPFADVDSEWDGKVEHALTAEHATFTERELRATALEQAAGTLAPHTALGRAHDLATTGQVIGLEHGRLTSRAIRDLEQSIVATTDAMAASDPARRIPDQTLTAAIDQASEQLGKPLSEQQQRAVRTITGPEHVAALEGQAGTGKSAVIDAAARAEILQGRKPLGVALAGATAQRLGHDSPALDGRTTTIASVLARHHHTGSELDRDTTLILDEAGMVDTPTLARLTHACHQAGAKLIAVGDGKQLPAIGPGGMFDQLTQHAPKAVLTTVHRTRDRDEQKAWRALRNGQPEKAMAHYLARDQLHLDPDRDHALNAAAERYDHLAQQHGVTQVALMSDGPTTEIDRLNARAQHLRAQRGELGPERLPIPGPDAPSYDLRAGDLITWHQIQPVPGDARIENGTRGVITAVDPRRDRIDVQLVGSGRSVTAAGPDELGSLRLAYAQHVVRQQGATVDRAVAVTGGWQTSRESTYVQASRARHGIDWHIPRDQLSDTGTDPDRIARLAERMAQSKAKTPSLQHAATNRPIDLLRTTVNPAIDVAPVIAPAEMPNTDFAIDR